MSSTLAQQQFLFNLDTPTGRWRWVTVLDNSKSVPEFAVRDITTPFGLYRDSIPIPGEVITAMSSSIDEITGQFPPNILVGPPSTLEFFVDEGRGYSEAQAVAVTNNGLYGSVLSVSMTTSAAYIIANPTLLGGLAYNQSGAFQVTVDSSELLSVASPIVGEVVVQDPRSSNGLVSLPVTINVRPKAEITVSPSLLEFTAVKPLSGSFAPVPTQQFTVTNTGPAGSILEFQVQRLTNLSPWLQSFAPVLGTLNSGESQIITVSVSPDMSTLQGVHSETLRVSGYSSNSTADVQVTLEVT